MLRRTLSCSLVVAASFALTSCELRIPPTATDPSITTNLSDHIVVFDETQPLPDRLFVFLPGTGGRPQNQALLLRTVAAAGVPAIGLTYPNDHAVNGDLCERTGDPDCFEDVRLETLDGVDRSTKINVTPANSIEHRLVALLDHLGWEQYLDGGHPRWEHIVIAGHSQGGGHAAMIAREHEVARVVFFASPGDWWMGNTAPWLLEPRATPADRYYGFVHLDDSLVHLVNWAALGLPGPITSVDDGAAPYGGSHGLVTDIASANPHGAVVVDRHVPLVGGKPRYAPVWEYLCCS